MRASQPSYIIVDTRITEIWMTERLLRAPRCVEEILSACAYDRRGILSVDKPHIIALAIPHRRRILHIIVDSYKMSLAFNVSKHIIVLTGCIFRLRTEHTPFRLAFRQSFGQLVVIPSMETAQSFRSFLHRHIINIVIEAVDVAVCLIFYFYPRSFLKRHGKIAGQPCSVVRTGRQRE